MNKTFTDLLDKYIDAKYDAREIRTSHRKALAMDARLALDEFFEALEKNQSPRFNNRPS